MRVKVIRTHLVHLLHLERRAYQHQSSPASAAPRSEAMHLAPLLGGNLLFKARHRHLARVARSLVIQMKTCLRIKRLNQALETRRLEAPVGAQLLIKHFNPVLATLRLEAPVWAQ